MKGLGQYFYKYKFHYLFALVCLYLGIWLDMQSPKIIGRIIDDVLVGGQKELLIGLVLGLLGIGIGRGVFKYLQEFIKERDVCCLVIITDGQAPYPKQAEAVGIPVLWIINNEKITPPWGKVARIKV